MTTIAQHPDTVDQDNPCALCPLCGCGYPTCRIDEQEVSS